MDLERGWVSLSRRRWLRVSLDDVVGHNKKPRVSGRDPPLVGRKEQEVEVRWEVRAQSSVENVPAVWETERDVPA